MENSFNESFNRRLQAECVKVEVFFTLDEAREKLDRWRQDYNLDRPHNPLNDWALVLVAAGWSESANTTAKQGELLEALT